MGRGADTRGGESVFMAAALGSQPDTFKVGNGRSDLVVLASAEESLLTRICFEDGDESILSHVGGCAFSAFASKPTSTSSLKKKKKTKHKQ